MLYSKFSIFFLVMLMLTLVTPIYGYALYKEYRINNIRLILFRYVWVYHQDYYAINTPKFIGDKLLKGYAIVLPQTGGSYDSPNNFTFPTQNIKVWKTDDILSWCRENIPEESVYSVFRYQCVVKDLYPAEYITFSHHIYKQQVMLLWWTSSSSPGFPEYMVLQWSGQELPSNPHYIVSAVEAYIIEFHFVVRKYSTGLQYRIENWRMSKITDTKDIPVTKLGAVYFYDPETHEKIVTISVNNIYKLLYIKLFMGSSTESILYSNVLPNMLKFILTLFVCYFTFRIIDDLSEAVD